jgi:hypothetical protein
MKRLVPIIGVICLSLAVAAEAPSGNNALALEKLRALAGTWQGTLEWSGARTGSGKVNATYYVTGNGSAIVEDLIMDGSPNGDPSMTSVYHLDGSDLRLTHFCGARNQPRLKADAIDLEHGTLKFSLVDVTNLRSPDAGYVHGLELQLLDLDHIVVNFRFEAAGKVSNERIDLKRITSGKKS